VTSSPEAVDRVAVGRISRAHGIQGEVAVLPLSEVETRFQPGSRVFAGEGLNRPLTVSAARPHRKGLLVRFRELPDRTAAETLAGTYLFVPVDELPSLPPGEYWPHQIVGSEVVTDGGRPLGSVGEVVHTVANDIWIARSAEGGEVLVPALKDVVISVDVDARRIVVRELPGITVPAESEGT
jgi:16S rRNA processing protein RimM